MKHKKKKENVKKFKRKSKKFLLSTNFTHIQERKEVFEYTISSSLFIHHFNYGIRALPGLENSYKHLVGAVFVILGDYYKC